MKKREWLVILLSLCSLLIALEFCGAALIPFGNGFGATWGSFRAEPENSIDVLFLGSSIVYCDVIPAQLYEETGISSYVMAGPEQTMPITYYYLREACRTQSPGVAVVELSSLFFHRYQNYTMANLVQMPYDENRFGAILFGAEAESRPALLIPVLEYHDRAAWLSLSQMQAQLDPDPDPLVGYTLLTGGSTSGTIAYRQNTGTEYDDALRYLRKISDYCAKHDITLLTYLAPCWFRPDPEQMVQLESDIPFISEYFTDCNTSCFFDSLALCMETDWYDNLHFNVLGAEKFTHRMGQLLSDLFPDLPDHRPDSDWEARVEAFRRSRESALEG